MVTQLDALIFSNAWVAVVNQAFFIFLNERLEQTKIILVGLGGLTMLSLKVCQRKWEIMCLCNDFKTIKFWTFKFTKESEGERRWQRLFSSFKIDDGFYARTFGKKAIPHDILDENFKFHVCLKEQNSINVESHYILRTCL